MDCRTIDFSVRVGNERREKLEKVLGEKVVQRIIAFSLFLLGAKRIQIAALVGWKEPTLRSHVRAMARDGLAALEDRRCGYSSFLPQRPADAIRATVSRRDEVIAVQLGPVEPPLVIGNANKGLQRAMLLSLVNSDLLSASEAAKALGLSVSRVRTLARNLAENDIDVLLDQRRGQQKEFVLTPSLKEEVMLQYSANIMTNRSTSSECLVDDIQRRSGLSVSARTLRYGIAKLGLKRLSADLLGLVDDLKKGSRA